MNEKRMFLYKGTKKIPSVFSESQINNIIQELGVSDNYWKSKGRKKWGEFLKMRDICIVATIYLLGLRPKEACCLKFTDFNLRQSYVKIRGCNNKVRKDRILPIPKTLLNFLKIYFQFPKDRFWKGSSYIFPSCQNNHISPERIKYIFREKALKPLGLWEAPEKNKVPKIRLYTLRHSRASHMLNKQIKKHGQPDLHLIANFLGHSDLRSTQVYLHTDEEYFDYMKGEIDL